MNDLLPKLKNLENRFEELKNLLSRQDIIADQKRYIELSREFREIEPVLSDYAAYRKIVKNLEGARDVLRTSDEQDFREMAEEEIRDLEMKEERLEEAIRLHLLPKDPMDSRNAIVEIRAGTGGDEAALFAGDLFRMYERYGEEKGWKLEPLSENPGAHGGFKEIIFALSGPEVFGIMKYESGVHRVQRVPATEASGRIHTSAASVAVLPEAEEIDIQIDPRDIRVDVFRSSGPGGQSVNTTDSAVRITHIPTGIVVSCQDEKSQHKNKAKALKVLRARLLDKMESEKNAEITAARRAMVSTGDRSAKIRTYNFPQNRVTDHRINLVLYSLDKIIEGNIDELTTQLRLAEQSARLEENIETE